MGEIDNLALLRLIHLADSALPIGATPHSFGLETLAFEGDIAPNTLAGFMRDYLAEAGPLDAVFCRAAYRSVDASEFAVAWRTLNDQYGAFRPARESRTASQTLGRRLIELVLEMHGGLPVLSEVLALKRPTYHSLAFGLVGRVLEISEETVVLAYLHQMLTGLHSACQRLMPLGQRQASRMLWELKATLIEMVQASHETTLDDLVSFTPLLDLSSMRHPMLETRLFIS